MKRFIFLLGLLNILEAQSQETINFYNVYTSIDNQIFIPVSLKGHVDYSKLESSSDSIISNNQDDELRKFISPEVGKESFNFNPKQDLILFDKFSNILGKAVFSHFEYHENMIESFFAANFKIIKKDLDCDKIFYCLSNNASEYLNKKLTSKENPPFITPHTKSIRKGLLFEDYLSYNNSTDIVRLIMLSKETTEKGKEETSFESSIHQVSNNSESMILQISKNYVLMDLYITKLRFNNHPVLISNICIPDTDYIDFAILVWDNNKYIVKEEAQIQLD